MSDANSTVSVHEKKMLKITVKFDNIQKQENKILWVLNTDSKLFTSEVFCYVFYQTDVIFLLSWCDMDVC